MKVTIDIPDDLRQSLQDQFGQNLEMRPKRPWRSLGINRKN